MRNTVAKEEEVNMGDMADYYGGESRYEDQSMGEYEEARGLLNAPHLQPTATNWVTRDGQRIPVRKMSDSHLLNTIAYLRRVAEARRVSELFSVGGYLASHPPDGAYDAASQAEVELEDMDTDDYLEATCPTFPAMVAEAEKRKLRY